MTKERRKFKRSDGGWHMIVPLVLMLSVLFFGSVVAYSAMLSRFGG